MKKLLVITESVDLDNPVLAFFHVWLAHFARHFEKVTVICLEKGRFDLPNNVEVLALGKKPMSGDSNLLEKVGYIFNFYAQIWRCRSRYDTVFVHMNPIYIVLCGLLWKVSHKRISLWYTHRSVDLKLKIAEKLCDKIFTASPESFLLPSGKVEVMGHGIEVERFSSIPRTKAFAAEPICIVHVGRITRIKNCETLINAAGLLGEHLKKKFEVQFVGGPVTDADRDYEKKLHDLVHEKKLEGIVSFRGPIANDRLAVVYGSADISVNLTPTGGMDKAVLESMAAGVPTLSSNAAFSDYFGKYRDQLIFEEGNAADLSQKIAAIIGEEDAGEMSAYLAREARRRANVANLITAISEKIS